MKLNRKAVNQGRMTDLFSIERAERRKTKRPSHHTDWPGLWIVKLIDLDTRVNRRLPDGFNNYLIRRDAVRATAVVNDKYDPDMGCPLVAEYAKYIPVDAYKKAQEAIKGLISAMEMQEKREVGLFHINQPTARKIWDDAKQAGRDAMREPGEKR